MSIELTTHETTATDCMPAPWTTSEIGEIVVYARLALYNSDMPCGPRALRKHLEEVIHIRPVPSERTIARMLAVNGLTHGRTGWYVGDSDVSVEKTAERR